jgi:hypothetical protein
MNKKPIICNYCSDEIKSKDDIVISITGLSIGCFHNACYSKELKSLGTFFTSNQPINEVYSIPIAIILSIISIIMLFIKDLWPISLVILIYPAFRFYAWFVIERHLD